MRRSQAPRVARAGVRLGPRGVALVCAVVLTALTAYHFGPALRCPERCLVDYAAVRADSTGRLQQSDARLNTWILAWVQHSLLTDPRGLFDANIFYPARHTLTQSEHMLAGALLTLPLRLFTDAAVAIHQAALAGSSWLLALTTFALVRWLTGSAFAALAAGAASIFMPWRLMELSHVQLLSAQWFPLVWLFAGRIVLEGPSRRDGVLLSLVAALQLLSSFYLAYYLVLSFAVWVAVLSAHAGLDSRRARALLAACVVPGGLLVAMSLPYLEWRYTMGFVGPRVFALVPPGDALSMTLPRVSIGWHGALPVVPGYQVPLAVSVLAALGLALGGRAGAPRPRAAAHALAAIALAAFAMCLGRELRLGDTALPLPGSLAALLVPGYENLRNPLRWALLIGLAAVPLAGIGIAALEDCFRRRRGAGALLAVRASAGLALALTLPVPQLPPRDEWPGPEQLRVYRALRALPFGPVMEIPWPLHPNRSTRLSSQYMLASTLHWRPLTNGMSGYVPRSYLLLRRLAQRLPHPTALARLHELVDVRFFVVHLDDLPAHARLAWERAVRTGALRRVYADGHAWILEMPDSERGGVRMEALLAPRPGLVTLTGESRARLAASEGEGRLTLGTPRPFAFVGNRVVEQLVPVEIENRGPRTWPGLDPHAEGLVVLRYAFLDRTGARLRDETAMLTEDVPPGATLTLPLPIFPPARSGSFRLRADLVQNVDGEQRPLAVPPTEVEAEVRELPSFGGHSQGARVRRGGRGAGLGGSEGPGPIASGSS